MTWTLIIILFSTGSIETIDGFSTEQRCDVTRAKTVVSLREHEVRDVEAFCVLK